LTRAVPKRFPEQETLAPVRFACSVVEICEHKGSSVFSKHHYRRISARGDQWIKHVSNRAQMEVQTCRAQATAPMIRPLVPFADAPQTFLVSMASRSAIGSRWIAKPMLARARSALDFKHTFRGKRAGFGRRSTVARPESIYRKK
jgi:hypothetical protein